MVGSAYAEGRWCLEVGIRKVYEWSRVWYLGRGFFCSFGFLREKRKGMVEGLGGLRGYGTRRGRFLGWMGWG